MLTLLRRLADRLTEAAAVAVLLTLLGSVVLGVVSRAVNQPMIWSDELARYLMVWLAFIGWILASRRRAHIRITAALDRLPRLARRGVEGVIQLALAIFGLLLMRDGFILVERNLDIDAVSLPVPAALLYVPILLASLSTILQAAAELADLAAGREPVPAPPGDALA